MRKLKQIILRTIALLILTVFSVSPFLNKGNTTSVHAENIKNEVGIKINLYYPDPEDPYTYASYDKVSSANFEDKMNEIKNEFKTVDPSYYSRYKCVIDLHGDCDFPTINTATLPIEIVLNLNDFKLTLSYLDSWKIYGGITINGSGTMSVVKPTEYPYSPMSFGALWVREGNVDVFNVDVIGCECDTYPVFSIIAMDGKTTPREAKFQSCNFKNCTSSMYGGAISISNLSLLQIINCDFENCSSYFGGAVCIHSYAEGTGGSGLFISTSNFKYCSATNGGAIYLRCLTSNAFLAYGQFINDTTFENCSATGNGGAIVLKGNSVYWDFSSHSKIINCSAGENGGAIYLLGYQPRINKVEIQSCSAKRGGGVYYSGTDAILSDSKIHNCSAKEQGGAYYSETPNALRFSNCDFSANTPFDGVGTIFSNGSIIIVVSIFAGIFLASTIVFMMLYLKEKKKKILN